MPTYSVPSPSGQNVDVAAPNQDLANQFAAQRFFQGLEAPAAHQPDRPSPYQDPLAQQIAAKRTGDPNAVPNTADLMHAANIRSNAEAEASFDAGSHHTELMKRQRHQALLNSAWEDDEPPPEQALGLAPSEMLLQEPDAPQSQQPLPQQPNRGPQRPWWLSPQRAALLQRLRQVRR